MAVPEQDQLSAVWVVDLFEQVSGDEARAYPHDWKIFGFNHLPEFSHFIHGDTNVRDLCVHLTPPSVTDGGLRQWCDIQWWPPIMFIIRRTFTFQIKDLGKVPRFRLLLTSYS